MLKLFDTSPGVKCNQLAGMLVALLVQFPPADADSLRRQLRSGWREYQTSCWWDRAYYRDGVVFNSSESRCVKFKCDEGMVFVHEEGCEFKNQCFRVGRRFWDRCMRYECITDNGGVNFYGGILAEHNGKRAKYHARVVTGECEWDKRCFSVGDRVQHNSIIYECVKDSDDNYKMRSTKKHYTKEELEVYWMVTACKWDGSRYNNGQVIKPRESPCVEFFCYEASVFVRKEGCEFKNQCYPVGSNFSHRCIRYKCTKENGGEHTYIGILAEHYGKRATYHARVDIGECEFRNRCVSVGDRFEHNSVLYECVKDSDDNYKMRSTKKHLEFTEEDGMASYRIEMSCIWDGSVYYYGDVINSRESSCVKFFCYEATVYVLKEGCEFKNQCYDVDSNFSHRCMRYKCTKDNRAEHTYRGILAEHNGKRATYHARVDIGECEFHNRCVSVGDRFEHNSILYECVKDSDDNYTLRSTEKHCRWDGSYYLNGDVFNSRESRCVKFKCQLKTVFVHEEGCEFNNKCYAVGERFSHDCIGYKCTKDNGGEHTDRGILAEHNGKRATYHARVDIGGCVLANLCYREGERFWDDCILYECVEDSDDTYNFRPKKKRCRSFSDQYYRPGRAGHYN